MLSYALMAYDAFGNWISDIHMATDDGTLPGSGDDTGGCPAGSFAPVGNDVYVTSAPAPSPDELVSIVGNFFSNNSSVLTILSLPALVSVNDFTVYNNATLTTINTPLLATGGAFYIALNPVLTGLSFPSLTTSAAFYANDNPALTAFFAPNWLPSADVNFVGCALDAASVNHILARCVAAGLSGFTVDVSGGTNAAPTGQGIADVATLTGAGNTVTTN